MAPETIAAAFYYSLRAKASMGWWYCNYCYEYCL